MSRKTRKLIWSAPLVAVFAVVGALAIFVATAPGGVFADEQTGQVDLEQPTAEGPRSIKLTWSPPDSGPAPIGYRIDVSEKGHVWSELVASQTETEYVHTLAEKDVVTSSDGATTSRYYRVYALNSHGPGQESEIKVGTTKGVNVPEPVETLTVSANGPNKVDVTWEPPTDTGGMSITGYTVLCKTDNTFVSATDLSSSSATKVKADIRSHTREKLDADTTYFCRVFATNKVGPSGSGAVKSATTDEASRPDAPTNLVVLQTQHASLSATSSFNLYWIEPENNGGRDIDGYIIEYKFQNEPWRSAIPTTVTGGFLTTAPPTGDGTDNVADAYPTANTQGIDYVHTLVADRDGDTATDDDPAPVVGNKIRYRIYARHEDGTSRASREASVTLVDTDENLSPDPEPDPRPAAPSALTAEAGTTPGTINLSWVHSVRTGYRIDVSEDGMHWDALEPSTNLKVEFQSGGIRRYIHDGLLPGAMRYYRVFPSDGGRYGLLGQITGGDADATVATASAGAAVAAKAAMRNSFTATAASPSQIDLSWDAPTGMDTGGRKIRRYLLEYSTTETIRSPEITTSDLPNADVDAFSASVMAIWVDGTSYEHKGLAADTRYYYRVRADNSVADGPDTDTDDDVAAAILDGTNAADATLTSNGDAALATAKTSKIAAPGAPHSLSAHEGIRSSAGDIGEQGVYLTWLTAKNGGPAEEYELVRKVADEDDVVVSIDASGDPARTFYNDDESQASLDNKERRYRVRAKNSEGTSAWTAWVTYPLGDHMHNAAPMPEGMIDDMTAAVGDDPSTMDVMEYFSDADEDMLTYSAMSSNDAVATAMIADGTSMLTVTFVGEGMATITVTATDAGGSGMRAEQMFDVTVSAVLMAPTNIRPNPIGSGSLIVGFDPVPGADGYYIFAGNLTNPDERTFREVVNNPDATSGGVDGLVIGDVYLVGVASFNGANQENLDGKLSELKTRTIE